MSQLIKSNQPCDRCGSHDAKAYYNDNEHCYSCGYHYNYNCPKSYINTLPTNFNGELPKTIPVAQCEYWSKWFKIVGIDLEDVNKAEISVSEDDGNLVVPMYYPGRELTGYELRLRNPSPGAKSLTIGKKYPILLENKSTKLTLILVEDIRSAIKLWSLGYTLACLMGTTVNKNTLCDLCKGRTGLIIWLDGDEAGTKAAVKIGTITKNIIKTRILSTHRDPKIYSKKEIDSLIRLDTML